MHVWQFVTAGRVVPDERPSLPRWGPGVGVGVERLGGVTLGDPEGQGWCMEGQRDAVSNQEKMTDLEGARCGDPGTLYSPGALG